MEKAKRKAETNTRKKPPPNNKEPTPNVLRKSVFDTKNYYYYFTEVWKDRF